MANNSKQKEDESTNPEYDSSWKEAIETYFKEFLAFFFPAIYAEVDFEKGYEFLDKELEKVVRDSVVGKRFADKLVKICLNDGSEQWILIHIEVQGYYDKDFERRMYCYNYRIYDRYNREVISIAILTDEDKGYKPCRHEINRWGFVHIFEFPVVKLIEYRDKFEELENNANPFAIIVIAHLRSLETSDDYKNRLFWKLTLVKKLYNKGYSREEILNLYRFIDWLMILPKNLSLKFHNSVKKYEEDKEMAFITTAEKIGIEQGIKQGIEQGIEQGIKKGIEQGKKEGLKQGLLEAIWLGLELKFGEEGLKLFDQISPIDSLDKLYELKKAIRDAKSCKEIETLIP